ncbi:MAG: hypothetical protein V3V28_08890 [Polaribacter sp.]|uniref:hypothetical protein n=1 Tax=Polaribacter sp. TaxID=1920175 RepID=UPI002F35383F
MLKKIIPFLFISIFFINCKDDKPVKLSSENYEDFINKEFTGDLAFETTSFVEKYWRVVGNTGFNKSVFRIAVELEKAGYVLEENATEKDILTYRIEKRPLKKPTWESVNAMITINNEKEPLLAHSSNRNMIALNSYSTPKEGVSAEVIHIKDFKNLSKIDVKGKIVFAETSPYRIYKAAIVDGKAAGIIYNQKRILLLFSFVQFHMILFTNLGQLPCLLNQKNV